MLMLAQKEEVALCQFFPAEGQETIKKPTPKKKRAESIAEWQITPKWINFQHGDWATTHSPN